MPLDRDEVLQGALRLLDQKGLDALTMRQLAEELGVQAGAIYWHFKNKQELIDAMVEKAMDGVLDPPLKGRWDEQLAEITRRIGAAMARHRDGALLATKTLVPSPNMLAVSEKMLGIVRDAGFSKEAAISATSVLGYYVLGYVTDMQATEAAKARGMQAVLRSVASSINKEQFPHLAELGSIRALEQMATERSFAARFEYGLDVILDGLRAALKAESRAAKPKSKPRRRR